MAAGRQIQKHSGKQVLNSVCKNAHVTLIQKDVTGHHLFIYFILFNQIDIRLRMQGLTGPEPTGS